MKNITKYAGYIPRVLRYLLPYKPLAMVSAIVIVLSGLVALLVPWPLQILVDHVLQDIPLPWYLADVLGEMGNDRYSLLLFAVLAGLAVVLVESGLTVLGKYVDTRLEQCIVLDFRSSLFQHAQRLSLSYHDQHRSGYTLFAINFQAGAAADLIMTVPPLAQSMITLVGMAWIVFGLDSILAIIALSVVPFLYYSIGYYTTHIEDRLRHVRSLEGETLSIIHEAISMLRVIVAFGRETHEFKRFRNQGQRALDARVGLTVRQTLFSLAVNMTTAVGSAMVLGFGAFRVLEGRLSVGQLLVVMAYVASVYKPLEAISGTIGSVQEYFVRLQLAFNLLDTQPDVRDEPGAMDVQDSRGQIRFEEVHFGYNRSRNALEDISFEARAGQVVAVVGPTGAGKTTLISLIPRFYDPIRGRILLDGADIRSLTVKSLRQQISIVQQEPLLFSGSIAENIRYGRLEASMDEVVNAAQNANVHEFIMGLPEKYDTQVGERGVKLSGGERQRICVARAFLKDAPILLLDEPTSSIDSKTEAVILDSLELLMRGRTTFIIAHRLSTIRHADIILVLDKGRIVEQGTHRDLLEKEGLYRELCRAQKSPPDAPLMM